MFSNMARTFLDLHRAEIDEGSQNLDKILTALKNDTIVPNIEKQYLAFLITYTLAGKKRFGITTENIRRTAVTAACLRYTVVISDEEQLMSRYRLTYWSMSYPLNNPPTSVSGTKADLVKVAIQKFGEKHRGIYTEILNDIFDNDRLDIIGV